MELEESEKNEHVGRQEEKKALLENNEAKCVSLQEFDGGSVFGCSIINQDYLASLPFHQHVHYYSRVSLRCFQFLLSLTNDQAINLCFAASLLIHISTVIFCSHARVSFPNKCRSEFSVCQSVLLLNFSMLSAFCIRGSSSSMDLVKCF